MEIVSKVTITIDPIKTNIPKMVATPHQVLYRKIVDTSQVRATYSCRTKHSKMRAELHWNWHPVFQNDAYEKQIQAASFPFIWIG